MDTEKYILSAVLVVGAALWCRGLFRCFRAVGILRRAISHMKSWRDSSFPRAELHPLLQGQSRSTPPTLRRSSNTDEGLDLAELPDPEEEKAYPYYNRTGQIVANAQLRSDASIKNGGWYGYSEWMQDMITGRVINEPEEKDSD